MKKFYSGVLVLLGAVFGLVIGVAFSAHAENAMNRYYAQKGLNSGLWVMGNATEGFVIAADDSPDVAVMAVGSSVARGVVLTDYDNRAKDHDHAAATNPTFWAHSATDPDTANDEWTGFGHDVTDGFLDTGSGGLKINTVFAGMHDVIRFCGQGANGTTAQFMGPVPLDDTEADMVYGGAGCDGLDSSTEATADSVWAPGFAFKVIGMMCSVDDGGTDDVYTFQMRDDTADVTGVTCNVTLDGAGFDQCTVMLNAPVTVAAASTVAIEAVAATDDNCSACDQECRVFITY